MKANVFDMWYYTEEQAQREADIFNRKGYGTKITRSKNLNRGKDNKLQGGKYIYEVWHTPNPKRLSVIKVSSHTDMSVKRKGNRQAIISTTDKPTISVSKVAINIKETKPRRVRDLLVSKVRRGIDLGAGVVRDRRRQHIPLD